MPTLLKNFFDRRNQPTAEEVQAMDCARMALNDRVERLLMKQDMTRGQSSYNVTTDRFGRALQ